MAVPLFLQTVEQTSLSTWLRDSTSPFGFYFVLLFHTLGFSLLVGSNAVISLRILGVAKGIPLKPLKGLFNVMWTGLAINFTTGLLLLSAYPTKALTNPVFYCKLTFIALGVTVAVKLYKKVFKDASLSEAAMVTNGKTLAIFSLLLWVATISAGRLLSETAVYLIYGHPYLG